MTSDRSFRQCPICGERLTAGRAHADSGSILEARDMAREEGEGATVIQVLRTLGWTPDDIAKLERSVPTDGWLEGVFNIRFKARRRRAAGVNREVLEEALRNLGDATIGLLGEGSEKDGLVRLSVKRQIPVDEALLDPTAAMSKIIEAMCYWAGNGAIDATFEP